ncbi:MAG: hypothetical protein K2Y05_04585 [Hyphomicrobiaceae bacterium]|nr:hypothetical protein [Hyphomicrobiaceae bacterium]
MSDGSQEKSNDTRDSGAVVPSGSAEMDCLEVVLNALHVDCQLPAEIVRDVVLRKPSEDECDRIRGELRRLSTMSDLCAPFEKNLPAWEDLPRSMWRYLVVVKKRTPQSDVLDAGNRVSNASMLTDIEVNCGLSIYSQGTGLGSYSDIDPFRTISFFSPPVQRVTEDWLKLVFDNDAKLSTVKQTYPEIGRSIQLFRHAVGLPDGHGLQFLGFFAVIESLLTHAPKGNVDSIGKQIGSKIPLLNRRMESPIDYSVFPGGPNGLWGSLYSLRSHIAHGGHVDFVGDQKLKPLVSTDCCSQFIRSVVKKLLRHALCEPELVLDLKRC